MNNKIGVIFWFLTCSLLSVILRLKLDPNADSDMGNYIRLMSSDIDLLYLNREFVFYGLSRTIYSLVNNEFIVFLFWDFTIFVSYFVFCNKICKNYGGKYRDKILIFILFTSILFFPFVLGMHTIYRQLIAAVIFLNSLDEVINGRKVKGILLFFIAFFIHNSVFLFLPLLLYSFHTRYMKTLSFVLLLVTSYLTFLVMNSSVELLYRDYTTNIQGPNITRMYLVSLSFFIFFILVIEASFTNFKNNKIFVYIIMMFMIYLSSVFAYSSGVSERVALFVYIIFYPLFTMYVFSIFQNKKLILFVYLHASLLPIFLLHNSTIDLTF